MTDKELDDLEARLLKTLGEMGSEFVGPYSVWNRHACAVQEAADAIAELRKEKAELEAALREISGVMTPLWQKIARAALKENTQ